MRADSRVAKPLKIQDVREIRKYLKNLKFLV